MAEEWFEKGKAAGRRLSRWMGFLRPAESQQCGIYRALHPVYLVLQRQATLTQYVVRVRRRDSRPPVNEDFLSAVCL
jgi:hypothetical protein